jgi:molybdopterin-guanine dinucleotide biosynthesis protein
MHPIVLGIIGDRNTGKTTVAQLLQTHADARAMAFSDGIYAEVAQAPLAAAFWS